MSNPAVSGLSSELHRERRLEEIRRDAEQRKPLQVTGSSPAGAPFPKATPEAGYYGLPILKSSPWSWEIPVYFFMGGAAGAAAVISAIASYTGADPRLVRHARWIAATGSVISPVLLTADLGRPERFLAMLRVFKPQSPMSVGVWTLLGFSSGAAAAAVAGFLNERYGPAMPLRIIENAGQFAAMAFGLPFSNYTGVLIGATAIPVWNQNAGDLPLHFGASGLSAAVGILELMGHRRSRALQILGVSAAAFELWQGIRIETRSNPELAPLKTGPSGWITRIGGLLSGPLPLALRLASLAAGKKKSGSLRRWAGLAAVAGSLITRFAWIHAGRTSAQCASAGAAAPDRSSQH